MAYRFSPADYVVRLNGKVRYKVLKLVKTNKRSAYSFTEQPTPVIERLYQCISDKGATYYFTDEELEPWKTALKESD